MIARRWSALFAAVLLCSPLSATAQTMPMAPATPAPAPNAAEAAFLAQMMRVLPSRYATIADAQRAGYVRYTNEDGTGAISYVNVADWVSPDVAHPAQLWYDVNGRLIGADYSTLQSLSPNGPPTLLGIAPARFFKIPAHVHYVLCTGAHCTYGKAVRVSTYATVGDPDHPNAAGLVKLGLAPDAASVRTVFLYPAIEDVSIWVVPNPLGQFADKNPSVVPSAHAGKGEDM
ncbi:MAG TPA: hypothetical protein VMD91_13785 [Candidatus Sulfotelmatobacter sp.]|nr:hypothetical protein [Candidatus Sulfotelmatobacter sp.]